jgi:hypothetical protein
VEEMYSTIEAKFRGYDTDRNVIDDNYTKYTQRVLEEELGTNITDNMSNIEFGVVGK